MDLSSQALAPFGFVRGVQKDLPIPDPALGAGFTVTVPGEGAWLLLALSFFFQTSAVVATRIPRLTVDDGTRTRYRVVSGQTQAASIGAFWTYAPGLGVQLGAASQGGVAAPLPAMLLFPGYRLIMAVGAEDAGDAITLGVVTVIELALGPERGPFPEQE